MTGHSSRKAFVLVSSSCNSVLISMRSCYGPFCCQDCKAALYVILLFPLKVCCLQHSSTLCSCCSQGHPGSFGQRLESQQSVCHLFSQLPYRVNLMCFTGWDVLVPNYVHQFFGVWSFLQKLTKTMKLTSCGPWPSMAIKSFCS